MSQEFQGDENAKTRSATLAQNLIDNAFREEQLDVEYARLAVDQDYKEGSLALEQAAANAVSLGSKSDTATLTYITNPERLNAYANGQLGDNKTQFEQTILNYVKPREVWDNELGAYVKGAAPELAPRILDAIKKGDPSFYNQVVKGGTTSTSATGAQQVDQQAAADAVNNPTPENLNTVAGAIFKNGKVDLTSPVWQSAKTTLYDPSIDYTQAIGISRVPTTIGKTLSEFGEEVGVGGGTGPEGRELSQANTDLQALANELLLLTTSKSDDRVLTFVQEEIEKEVANMRPGGLFFKTDADARSALASIAKQISLGIEQEASKVPEFGGDPSQYKPEQVTRSRELIRQMIPLLNEVLAFQRNFQSGPVSVQSRQGTTEGVAAAVEYLNNLATTNNQGVSK